MGEGKSSRQDTVTATGRIKSRGPFVSMTKFPLRGALLAQYLTQSSWAEFEIRTLMYLVTEFCRQRGLDVEKVIFQDEIMWPSSALHSEFKEFCKQITQRIAAFTEV